MRDRINIVFKGKIEDQKKNTVVKYWMFFYIGNDRQARNYLIFGH